MNYVNRATPVHIVCPKHGDFMQTPGNHLKGQGCPTCNESKGEKLIDTLLTNNKINFLRQHKFLDCTNKIKGSGCRKLPFDFFIPHSNTCIEYDGRGHFEPIWSEEGFERTQITDKLKNLYCKKNSIKLIRIPYTMSPEEIEVYLLMELGLTD